MRPPLARRAAVALAVAVGACKTASQPAPSDDVTRTQTPVNVYTNASGDVSMRVNTDVTARASAVDAPVDRVWALLPAAYEALKLPLTTRQDASRTLGAQNVRLRGEFDGRRLSRYLSCGRGLMGGDAADSYEVTLDVVSVVSAAATGGGASLQSTATAVAKPVQTSGDPVQCVSTGRLEERLAELVRARLVTK